MESLSERLGYNNDFISIFEAIETDEKNEIGKPVLKYIKHLVKGMWEYKVKTIRKNGVNLTSFATLKIPFNPYKKKLYYEKGISPDEKPGKDAVESLSFEEVTRLRSETIEWIIYL